MSQTDQLRDFILAIYAASEPEVAREPLTEAAPEIAEVDIISELSNISFRLRSQEPTEEGDVGFGIGLGFERAADMIDALLRKISG